jgi:hypothetical protein
MPEYDENGNEIEPEDEGLRGLRSAKKAAEDRAKAAEEQLIAAQGAQRELAAMKAGLDPDDKAASFFLKHYDGEFTPEAMKAAAVDAGVLPEIDAAAQESAQGQAQMASAFRGGENTPLGSTFVGPREARIEVPADEAEKWQAFEADLARGGNGLDVLRQYGHPLGGTAGDYEYDTGAGAPATTPISGRPFDG